MPEGWQVPKGPYLLILVSSLLLRIVWNKSVFAHYTNTIFPIGLQRNISAERVLLKVETHRYMHCVGAFFYLLIDHDWGAQLPATWQPLDGIGPNRQCYLLSRMCCDHSPYSLKSPIKLYVALKLVPRKQRLSSTPPVKQKKIF